MRVVGGELRGRRLATPSSSAVRPTSDRLRETLFDILAHRYGDPVSSAHVLDLFAGTGALGIEALSRGSGFALFVEKDPSALALVRRNIDTLGLADRASIHRRDACRLGVLTSARPFALVFADPPYGQKLGEKALAAIVEHGWLARTGLCVLEESRMTEIGSIDGLEICDARSVGESQLVFLKRL
ncbi:MAG: 16S rRNA (guanine(966)-N(2))-methyltransferase RsmD [Hyphomicrobiales bacterium]|nr:16S rRNA (guanine(966)-N(2))-methyltransferase RsmD [Hyphomicrobiales bacterium]